MANSKLKITWNAPSAEFGHVTFQYRDLASGNPTLVRTIRMEYRQSGGFLGGVIMTDVVPYTTQLSASDYRLSFNIFWSLTGLEAFGVNEEPNAIEIIADRPGFEFFGFSYSTGSVNFNATNEPYVEALKTEQVEFLAATTNPVCTHVRVRVTANKNVDTVISPVSLNPGTTTFEFEYPRGETFALTYGAGSEGVTESQTTPAVLPPPDVIPQSTPTGTTVLINVPIVDINLSFEYSNDGVTYGDDPLFPGMLPGNHIAYVRDNFGCITQKAFTIDAFTPQIESVVPSFYISELNSIRYKENVVWDNKTIYKTEDNTLSFEEFRVDPNVQINAYYQRFQSNDKITTQILTNYKNLTVLLEGYNGQSLGVGKQTVSLNKKTDYIGRKDFRDCKIYRRSDGKTGLYFVSGNIYDYDDINTITGTYNQNSELPEWATIGRSIWVEHLNSYFTIENIIEGDSEKGTTVIVFDGGYNPGVGINLQDTKVQVLYNLYNYDAYEFTINMADYENKCFQVNVTAQDDRFTTINRLSELIQVKEFWPGLMEVKYKNTKDNDMLWSTGIDGLVRLDYEDFDNVRESEKEVHKVDTGVTPLDTDQYPKKKLILVDMSTKIADQVQQIFGQDTVLLYRDPYVTDSVEEPAKQGNSNFYGFSVDVYKNPASVDVVYNDIGFVFPELFEPANLQLFSSGGFDFILLDDNDPYSFLST